MNGRKPIISGRKHQVNGRKPNISGRKQIASTHKGKILSKKGEPITIGFILFLSLHMQAMHECVQPYELPLGMDMCRLGPRQLL